MAEQSVGAPLAAPAAPAAPASQPVDLLRDRKVTMNDLMHWSIKYSDAETLHELGQRGRETPHHEPIDPKWIEAMFPMDSNKMQEALRVLDDPASPLDEKEYGLDLLLFLVDTIDNAMDLPRLGAFPVLERLVRQTEAPQLAVGALWVMATTLQNNPAGQETFLASPTLLPLMLDVLAVGGARGELGLKAVGVLSALCMSEASVSAMDARAQLLTRLLAAYAPTDAGDAAQRRLLFLFTKLAGLAPAFAQALVAGGIVDRLALTLRSGLGDDTGDARERVQSLLGALAEAGSLSPEMKAQLLAAQRGN